MLVLSECLVRADETKELPGPGQGTFPQIRFQKNWEVEGQGVSPGLQLV